MRLIAASISTRASCSLEDKVAVEGVDAAVGHVLAVGGEIADVVLGRALERLFRMARDALGQLPAHVEEELVIALVLLRDVALHHRFDRFRLLRIEAENVGQRSRLHVHGLHRAVQDGQLRGRELGPRFWGLARHRGGLDGVGLGDRPDLIEAEGDRFNRGLAGENALAQGGFLRGFVHGGAGGAGLTGLASFTAAGLAGFGAALAGVFRGAAGLVLCLAMGSFGRKGSATL